MFEMTSIEGWTGGIVERVVLLGAPLVLNTRQWQTVRKVPFSNSLQMIIKKFNLETDCVHQRVISNAFKKAFSSAETFQQNPSQMTNTSQTHFDLLKL